MSRVVSYNLVSFDTSTNKELYVLPARIVDENLLKKGLKGLGDHNHFVLREMEYIYLFFRYSGDYMNSYFSIAGNPHSGVNLGDVILITNDKSIAYEQDPMKKTPAGSVLTQTFTSNRVTVTVDEHQTTQNKEMTFKRYTLKIGTYLLEYRRSEITKKPDFIKEFVAKDLSNAAESLKEFNEHVKGLNNFLTLLSNCYNVSFSTPLHDVVDLVEHELPAGEIPFYRDDGDYYDDDDGDYYDDEED